MSRIPVEESRHNQQYQHLHKDEEAEHKRSVIEKRVGISDVSAHHEPADYPDQLTFPIPHLLFS